MLPPLATLLLGFACPMDFFVSSYNYTRCTASSTGSILCLNENKDNMSKEMKMLTRIADSNR